MKPDSLQADDEQTIYDAAADTTDGDTNGDYTVSLAILDSVETSNNHIPEDLAYAIVEHYDEQSDALNEELSHPLPDVLGVYQYSDRHTLLVHHGLNQTHAVNASNASLTDDIEAAFAEFSESTDKQTTIIVDDVEALIDHIEAGWYHPDTAGNNDPIIRRVVIDDLSGEEAHTELVTRHENAGTDHPVDQPDLALRAFEFHDEQSVSLQHPKRTQQMYGGEEVQDYDEARAMWRAEVKAALVDSISDGAPHESNGQEYEVVYNSTA